MKSIKRWMAQGEIKKVIPLDDLHYLLQELDRHEVAIRINNTNSVSYNMLGRVNPNIHLKYVLL